MKPKRRTKKVTIITLSALAVYFLLVLPIVNAIVYEIIFSSRFQTPQWASFSPEDYAGLSVERSDFENRDGIRLAGYKYAKALPEPKGVVVFAHGLGGGQNTYMPFADRFTSEGYYVFAYDVTGNDQSGGDSVEGLPQGVADLDSALDHVATVPEYKNLPVMLFGHSWGAYAAANVLSLHPEIRAAAIIAGFNQSEDMIRFHGTKYIGPSAGFLSQYVVFYERIKFGSQYADICALESMAESDARILIAHSLDDETVPAEFGYELFYEQFGEDPRFCFVSYEDRGHGYLFYSEAARNYREQLNKDYDAYARQNGGYSEALKTRFMEENLDKHRCFDPDPELMAQILNIFSESIP